MNKSRIIGVVLLILGVALAASIIPAVYSQSGIDETNHVAVTTQIEFLKIFMTDLFNEINRLNGVLMDLNQNNSTSWLHIHPTVIHPGDTIQVNGKIFPEWDEPVPIITYNGVQENLTKQHHRIQVSINDFEDDLGYCDDFSNYQLTQSDNVSCDMVGDLTFTANFTIPDDATRGLHIVFIEWEERYSMDNINLHFIRDGELTSSFIVVDPTQ